MTGALCICLLLLFALPGKVVAYTAGQDITSSFTESTTTWVGATGTYNSSCYERYQTANYTTSTTTESVSDGRILYYSKTDLESAGFYEVQFYAVANSTSGRGFDNKYGDDIAQWFVNDQSYDLSVIDQTSCTIPCDAYLRKAIVYVSNGHLEFGLKNIAIGGNWYVVKLKSITYQGATPSVSLQWNWTGEQLVAEQQYYLMNVGNNTFVTATTTTVNSIDNATLYYYRDKTSAGSNKGFFTSTSDDNNRIDPNGPSVNATTSSSRLFIENYQSAPEYLYYVKYSYLTTTKYLGDNGSYTLNNKNDGTSSDAYRWRAISASQKTAYTEYVTAWNTLNSYLSKSYPTILQNKIAAALGTIYYSTLWTKTGKKTFADITAECVAYDAVINSAATFTNKTNAYLYTTIDNLQVALGSGSSYGTRATLTTNAASQVTINSDATSKYTQVKFSENKYLFDAGSYTIYTDGTSSNNFLFVPQDGGGYKIYIPNDLNYAIGHETVDGVYVMRLVAAADADIFYLGDTKVTLQVLGTAQKGTFCAPFDVTVPDGVSAYTVFGVSGSQLTLQQITDGIIPAGTPVLLEQTGTETISQIYYGMSTANPSDDYILKGVYALTEVAVAENGSNYLLQVQNDHCAFYKVTSTGLKIGANRCYLHYEGVGAPEHLEIDEQEETPTELKEVKTEASANKIMIDGKIYIVRDNLMYDLTGRLIK